ncbi:MAG: TIR domain-containing protein [bacterium]|nr:TIR domain-containing protein [bacterium]
MDDPALHALAHIFAGTDVDNEVLIGLRSRGRIVQHPGGTVLCHEGRIEDTFYVLLEGHADIYRSQDGEPMLIDTLNPGTCFGELAMILQAPRSADVVTVGPVTVLELQREAFNDCIRNNSTALLGMAQLVIKRMLGQEEQRLMQLASTVKKYHALAAAFVSYARSDEALARTFVTDLKKHQIRAWIDVFDIEAGKSWARQIGEALDRCTVMILLLSPAAILSGHVEDEWNYYLDKGKPILPVLVKPCAVPYRLHKLQYIDYTDPTPLTFTRLISQVRSLMDGEISKQG